MATPASPGARAFAALGALAFAASLALFAASYLWRFDEAVPRDAAPVWRPLAVNALLFSAFALHHSAFARLGLRAWIARRATAGLERPIYIWVASALFAAVCWWWQPVPGVLWRTDGVLASTLAAVQLGGVVLVGSAIRRLDLWEFVGVRAPDPAADRPLASDGPYALVRHPVYCGWLAVVFAAPVMTGTRLSFAVISLVYLLAAIPYEERDLGRSMGAPYEAYRRKVRWRLVPFVY